MGILILSGFRHIVPVSPSGDETQGTRGIIRGVRHQVMTAQGSNRPEAPRESAGEIPANAFAAGKVAAGHAVSEKISAPPTHCDKLLDRVADMMLPLIHPAGRNFIGSEVAIESWKDGASGSGLGFMRGVRQLRKVRMRGARRKA